MTHNAIAVMTVAASGGMQSKHHLVPPMILAQALGEASDVTLGQLLKLLHHLLALVHGVKTMDPKHNLNLDFQGQHITKRFVPRID